MQKIFISSFCVLFEDYDLLEQLCKSCPEVPMGAELGTSWPIPNFDEGSGVAPMAAATSKTA